MSPSDITRLKNLDLEVIDIDDAVALSMFGRDLKQEYERLQIEEPEWLDDRLRSLRHEIRARQADAQAKRLRELKARREALKPTEVRRQELDEQIAKLEQLTKTADV